MKTLITTIIVILSIWGILQFGSWLSAKYRKPTQDTSFHFSVVYQTNYHRGYWDRENEIDNISGIPNLWHQPRTNVVTVLLIQTGTNTFKIEQE
jgi:hypothetical protein